MASEFILHLCSNRWNSAIAEYLVSTAKALQARPQHFVVLRGSPLAKRLNAAGFSTTELAHFRITKLWTLMRLIRDRHVTQVIAYGGPEAFLSVLAKHFTSFRLLRFFGDASRLERGDSFRCAPAVDVLIVPSKRLALALQQQSPGRTITEVVLGCDEGRFRFNNGLTRSTRPKLLIFGRFDPIKGHVHAMQVFKKLLDGPKPAGWRRPQLWIVGLPANLSTEALRGAASDLGLNLDDDVIIRSEQVEDVPELMRSIDIGWVSSQGSELICRVAEEFLLCGTSIFVSGVGSLEECLAFPGAGLSYQGLDQAMAASKLAELIASVTIESTDERKQRANQAKLVFGLGAMRARLEQVLQRPAK